MAVVVLLLDHCCDLLQLEAIIRTGQTTPKPSYW